MRQQRVLEVEGGSGRATDRPDPLAETRRTSASSEAVEDPGRRVRAPGQMSGGHTADADSTLKTS